MIQSFRGIGDWLSESFKPVPKSHNGRSWSMLLDDIKQPFNALTNLIFGIGMAIIICVPMIFSFIGWLITLPVAIFIDPKQIWKDIESFFAGDRSPIYRIRISLLNIVVTPFTWLIRIPARLIATACDNDDTDPIGMGGRQFSGGHHAHWSTSNQLTEVPPSHSVTNVRWEGSTHTQPPIRHMQRGRGVPIDLHGFPINGHNAPTTDGSSHRATLLYSNSRC